MLIKNFDLGGALKKCPATVGMGQTALEKRIRKALLPSADKTIDIAVPGTKNEYISYDKSIRFMVHEANDKIIVTAMHCMSSESVDGIPLDFLGTVFTQVQAELESIYHPRKVSITALQFPHAFKVNAMGFNLRAHYNNIIIYKDASEQLNVSIIDSTQNPIGVYNPLPILGWWASRSIISFKELTQSKLTSVLSDSDSWIGMFGLEKGSKVNFTSPIITAKQPLLNDKRCGIYALNFMVSLINYITSDVEANSTIDTSDIDTSDVIVLPNFITFEGITSLALDAHEALNQPAMMRISFSSDTEEPIVSDDEWELVSKTDEEEESTEKEVDNKNSPEF